MNDVLSYQERIRRKLTARFAPGVLEIRDDSKKHQGHAGLAESKDGPEGETHFSVVIVSEAFAGLGLRDRHRLVYETLAAELKERVHALAVSAKTAAEYR